MSNSDDEFEEQIRLEAAEKKREEDLKAGKLKVDPDGTVYDWDEEKKAWFPRIDEDFIARYQMSYGTNVSSENPSEAKDAGTSQEIPPPPSVNDPGYAEWYYKYYGNFDSSYNIPYDTNSKEYKDWYNYYYGKGNQGQQSKSENDSSENKNQESETSNKDNPSVSLDQAQPTSVDAEDDEEARKRYEEYYAYYYQHYGEHPQQEGSSDSGDISENKTMLDPSHPDYWEQYHHQESTEEAAINPGDNDNSEKKDNDEEGKKGKKRKPPEPPKWFDVDPSKSTTVYVAGLPESITDEQFLELMNKCGLVAFDPRSKKPNMKLYKDEHGKNKGDGRCCYIKPESVDLALQMLDGYDVEGHKISVERAKFELKGEYDPKKKKKKLSNAEKKKLKERQEKLFDWRPDKPRGARNRWERVVIIKNFFNPRDFDKNPELINEIRQDLREECTKYGEVKKVMIFDRHPDGIASVYYKTPEEADVCIEALNGRFFACKQITAAAWDGKSKYEIEENEEQREKRLKQWENFLEEDEGLNQKDKEVEKQADSGDGKGAVEGVVTEKQDGSGASS